MKTNQQTAFCADQKLDDIADAMELIRDAIKTGNEDIIKSAVNAMSNEFPWLKDCVTDIRMLRIEENNDLTPAL